MVLIECVRCVCRALMCVCRVCRVAADRSAERINRLIGEEGGKLLGNFANASLASQCKKRSGYPGLPSTILLSAKPRTYVPTPHPSPFSFAFAFALLSMALTTVARPDRNLKQDPQVSAVGGGGTADGPLQLAHPLLPAAVPPAPLPLPPARRLLRREGLRRLHVRSSFHISIY